MSEPVAPIEVGNALLQVKRSLRSVKSYSGMVKTKLAAIDSTITVITEKVEDIASETPTTDVLNMLRDAKTKIDTQIRAIREVVSKGETVSDALDAIVG